MAPADAIPYFVGAGTAGAVIAVNGDSYKGFGPEDKKASWEEWKVKVAVFLVRLGACSPSKH